MTVIGASPVQTDEAYLSAVGERSAPTSIGTLGTDGRIASWKAVRSPIGAKLGHYLWMSSTYHIPVTVKGSSDITLQSGCRNLLTVANEASTGRKVVVRHATGTVTKTVDLPIMKWTQQAPLEG
jgi:hypothetical protein